MREELEPVGADKVSGPNLKCMSDRAHPSLLCSQLGVSAMYVGGCVILDDCSTPLSAQTGSTKWR